MAMEILNPQERNTTMFETILFYVAMSCVALVFMLCLLSCSADFLTWGAKKDDPEWAAFYEEHLSDFLRMKYSHRDSKWGS